MAGRQAALIGMVAETHVHVGVGQASGALDLPIARERATHWPFIPGSGMKGGMRVWAREHVDAKAVRRLFGTELSASLGQDDGSLTQAGSLVWSDAKLILLPVRSTSGSYRFVTSASLINRLRRDKRRVGLATPEPDLPDVDAGCYDGADGVGGWLGLEEREFKQRNELLPESIEEITPLVIGTLSAAHVACRMVVISDNDMSWFARFSLPIMSRNRLDENKAAASQALWNEEALAPDTVMYGLVADRTLTSEGTAGGVAEVCGAMVDGGGYVQLGGNETIGQGWFSILPLEADGESDG